MLNWPRHVDVTAPAWRPSPSYDDSSRDGPIELLRGLLSLAARYKVIVLVCMAAGITAAYFYAQSLPPTYTATTTLLLEPRRAATSVGETGSQQILDLNRADGELQTIRSERLLSSVFDSLDLQDSEELGPQRPGLLQYVRDLAWSKLGPVLGADATWGDSQVVANPSALLSQDDGIAAFFQFANRLTARRVGQSFVLEIEYSSSDPSLPARVANATASAYIFQVIAFKEQIARTSTEALQGRLDSLSRQVEAARDAMRSGTLPAIPTPDADARVIGAALPPLGPSGPRKSIIIALGGVLGLIGGCSLIALRLALDRRVKNGKELSLELRIPCFGSLPRPPSVAGRQGRGTETHRQHFVSALRDIRTSIEVACSAVAGPGNTVIAVVSFTPNPGVSIICRGLAELINRTDKCVTLFASNEGEMGNRGRDQAIKTVTSLADAPFLAPEAGQIDFEASGLLVVPLHSVNDEANLFADFTHPRVETIIDMARNRGAVLVNLPSLSLSMDGLALARYADAVIIIADAGKTTIDEVAEAAALVRRTSPGVIGTVIYR
jgi:polysaccharide biosynthesis transport protein